MQAKLGACCQRLLMQHWQVLMGIPCGLFGGAFQEYAEEVEKQQSDLDVEAKLSGSKVGAGYLTSSCIEELTGLKC
eukprot:4030286-Amphidinium_carterae.1